MKKFFIFLSFLICNFIFAQIVEIKSVDEIKNIETYDLIIFDLDNTIYEPVQLFGSDQWFYNTLKQYEKEEQNSQKALEKTLCEYYEIQSITKVKLVEKGMKDLIERLQNKNVKVMGFSLRNVELVFSAIKQISSLNIDLSKTSPIKDDFYFEDGVTFKKGILFANGKNKNLVLKRFLEKVNFLPKSIVFIDDKLKHIKDVEDFCKTLNIEFYGYRYGCLDEKVKNFNSEITDIQHKNFNKILSDEEAIDYINSKHF